MSWLQEEGAEPCAPDGPGDMSKTDILRGIIAEKLSTAAREILAVVERTVADYEREATGFRLEIERQRRHLELLKPDVKLESPEDQQLLLVCESGRGRLAEDDEEDKYEPSVQNMSQTEEEEEEEEPLTDLDHTAATRSVPPLAVSDRTGVRPWVSEQLVQLRIRILEDPEVEVLSASVFKKYPLHELQCPAGLQEADFLDLLGSTFPQLAAYEPFDFFITDRRRRLQPLQVQTLTPEEIHRTIRTSGNSALYIRLQRSEEQRSAAETSSRGDWISDTHVDLRVRVLEDSNINVISPSVFSKYPFQDVKCPRGLQEAAFLDLLRSTFPQLPRDQPLTISTSHGRRLVPLRAQSLTPEEICRTKKSPGRPIVYVQVKCAEDHRAGRHVQRHSVGPPSPGEAASVPCVRRKRGRPKSRPRGRPRSSHITLRLHILDPGINMMLPFVFQKYPLHELQCPRGLQEADFLDLLRSTFPQLAADEPFDFFIADRRTTRRLKPLQVQTLTPEKIHRTIRTSGNSALYIRLQRQDGVQRKGDQSRPLKPTASVSSAGRVEDVPKMAVRTREQKAKAEPAGGAPIQLSCKVCCLSRGSMNMLIKHAWSHVTEQERLCGVCGLQAESAEELRRHLQTHQKTHRCDICGKSFLTVIGLRGHQARHSDERPYQCKTCLKAFTSRSVLQSHEWTHRPEKPHKCDVCQKSFMSVVKLRDHQLIHKQRFRCGLCRKRFGTVDAVKEHMALHPGYSGNRLRVCKVCGRIYSSKKKLLEHQRYHLSERLHACSRCSKRFVARSCLQIHMRVHTGEKPYKCGTCGKAFSQKHCVKRHQSTHHRLPADMSHVSMETGGYLSPAHTGGE